MSGSVSTSEVMSSGGVDPRFYLRVILRRKWLILLVFALTVGASTIYTTRQPRVFAAQISLIIDSKEPRFLDSQIQDVNTDTNSYYWANKEYLETVRSQHQSELENLQKKHVARVAELESELKTLQEKYDSETALVKSNINEGTESLKASHAAEIEALKAAHEVELKSQETITRVCICELN